MFCQKCFDEQRPHDGCYSRFSVRKTIRYGFIIMRHLIKENLLNLMGFTPHFVVLDKVVDNKAHFNIVWLRQVWCWYKTHKRIGWKIDIVKTTPIIINLNDYLAAMETFTDTGFKKLLKKLNMKKTRKKRKTIYT